MKKTLLIATNQERLQKYLNSRHWKELHTAKRQETPRVCVACNLKQSYVWLHHIRFPYRLDRTTVNDVCWVCVHCVSAFRLRADCTKLPTDSDAMIAYIKQVVTGGVEITNDEDRKKLVKSMLLERRSEKQKRRLKHEQHILAKLQRTGEPHSRALLRQGFDATLSQIKKRSPLQNSLARQVVAVNRLKSVVISRAGKTLL